jgi:membrane protein DedA with SNARE-associated domain
MGTLIVAGYLLGDYISEDAFHRRLLRAIGLVVVLLALNFLLLVLSGTAWPPTNRSA